MNEWKDGVFKSLRFREKFRFRDGLVRTVVLTKEIKVRFQISSAQYERCFIYTLFMSYCGRDTFPVFYFNRLYREKLAVLLFREHANCMVWIAQTSWALVRIWNQCVNLGNYISILRKPLSLCRPILKLTGQLFRHKTEMPYKTANSWRGQSKLSYTKLQCTKLQ